jgi:hypothetical protein
MYICISQSSCSHNMVNPISEMAYRNIDIRNT